MNNAVFAIVIVYCVIVCIVIGLVLILRDKLKKVSDSSEGDFALAGRKMNYATLIPTMALTAIGNAHFTGMFEMSYGVGATALWFIFANTVHMCILCLCTGPWLRKMGVATISQAIEKVYGTKVRLAVSCVMSGVTFGVLTVECQGMGIIFSSITGFDLVKSIIICGIFGICYVIIAGMKEVGVVNLINIVILYAGIVLAVVFIAVSLGGNFDVVQSTFASNSDLAFMDKIFASPKLWFSFALANILSVAFYGPVSQANCQAPMAARNTKIIRRSLWVAAPINALFGVFSVTIGLTARALPEYASITAPNGALQLILDRTPWWVAALTLASALAACLSSFAMTALGCGTMFGYDIYKAYYKPDATEKNIKWVIRLTVIVLCTIAISISAGISSIIGAMNWVFAWIAPVFFLFIFGLFWKRSSKVAGITLAITWIVNMLWSLVPAFPAFFGTTSEAVPNGYVTAGLGLACALIGNLIVRDAKPGYFKGYLKDKSVIAGQK